MRLRYLAMASAIAVVPAVELGAQVGYPPRQSPFRDLRETQAITFYTGYYRAKLDPARVAPRSGPILGAHYQWRASGPANISFDLARVESERNVLDPERPATCSVGTGRQCKSLGRHRWPLYTADFGLALALTGSRSFLNLVPEVRAGGGIITDFHTKPDVGEFAFGTRFAFNWGAGIRWVPGGRRYQVRADVLNRLYSVRYPTTYYQTADDGSTIFTAQQNRSAWLNNPAFTIGVSYLFSR
jgi:hypothetical protein